MQEDKNNIPTNNQDISYDFMIFMLLLIAFFGFNTPNSSEESYLKGKIDAYENVLKGFDDNVR